MGGGQHTSVLVHLHWSSYAIGLPVVYLCYETTNIIRPLTDDERLQLEADRRTADASRVRRAQIVLASARGLSPKPI